MSRSKTLNWSLFGAIIVGVAFFAFVGLTGLMYVNQPAHECAGQAEHHERQTERLPLRSEQHGANRSDYSPQQHEQYETCAWGHSAEQWLAFLTLWLVAGTVLLAAFTATLWLGGEESARAQRKAEKEAHRRELRAYVTKSDVGHVKIGVKGNMRIGLRPNFRNGGKTPARRVRSYSSWAIFPGKLPDDFGFFDIYSESERASIDIVGPGNITILSGVAIPTAFLDRAAEGGEAIYVWGWIDYDDIFDGTPRHRTEFCFSLDIEHADVPADSDPSSKSVSIGFPNHSRYNGADEDCLRQPLPHDYDPERVSP